MIDTHISILSELKRTIRVNLSPGFLDYHPTQCDICSLFTREDMATLAGVLSMPRWPG